MNLIIISFWEENDYKDKLVSSRVLSLWRGRWLRLRCIAQLSLELLIDVMEFVYPDIFGLSGMFCRYLSSLCLKLVTEHPVWPRILTGRLLKSCGPTIWRLPSLIALILPYVHCFIWGTWHRRPYLVGVYDCIPTFGGIPSRIFQMYIIQYLSSSSPENILGHLCGLAVACWTTDHYHPCLNPGVGISEGCFIFDFA